MKKRESLGLCFVFLVNKEPPHHNNVSEEVVASFLAYVNRSMLLHVSVNTNYEVCLKHTLWTT